jgi:hypothetical protein
MIWQSRKKMSTGRKTIKTGLKGFESLACGLRFGYKQFLRPLSATI